MQIIKIFFVDRNQEETNLRRVLKKTTVLNVEPAFTYGQLRKCKTDEYHFFKSKYKRTIIFGKVLTLSIEESDFSLLQVVYGNHFLEEIIVNTIIVNDIYKSDFELVRKENVYTFISNDKSKDNRKSNVGNFSKYFLI